MTKSHSLYEFLTTSLSDLGYKLISFRGNSKSGLHGVAVKGDENIHVECHYNNGCKEVIIKGGIIKESYE